MLNTLRRSHERVMRDVQETGSVQHLEEHQKSLDEAIARVRTLKVRLLQQQGNR